MMLPCPEKKAASTQAATPKFCGHYCLPLKLTYGSPYKLYPFEGHWSMLRRLEYS